MRNLISACVLVAVMALACTPSQGSPSSKSSATSQPSGLGASGCQPVSPTRAFTGEVQGTATGGTVWAWFMQSYPPQAGVEDKTVFRLNGPGITGPPTFTLVGPAGASGSLNWGPEGHLGSTWNRPGNEYGTGLLFPVPGCWDVHVSVGDVTGDVYVVVAS